MVPSIYSNYFVPAVLLNPVLVLHSFNAILSRILPPVPVDAAIQPQPYHPLGPSAEHPHVDMHANDNLCWSYTMVMVCAQLVAFGRVNRRRGEMRERREEARKQNEQPAVTCKSSLKEIPLPVPDRQSHKLNGIVKPIVQAAAPCDWQDQRRLILTDGPNGHLTLNDSKMVWDLGS